MDVYFPQGKWYDWYTHQVVSANGGETKTIDTPIDMIPVCCTRVLLESTDDDILIIHLYPQIHLRGGTVIPMQKPGNTTRESRKNDYTLLVVPDATGEASGDIFLDDGLSIDIKG